MRYYVVSDVHGFYQEMIDALTSKGWFEDECPKKLIICGDMMDRGSQAQKMQEFMMQLLNNNQLIFIRGNHEDLMLTMLDDIQNDFKNFDIYNSYHIRNRTLDTASQLVTYTFPEFVKRYKSFVRDVRASDFVSKLIPASVNYFETKKHIFVHGWIPCNRERLYGMNKYSFKPNWRQATDDEWKEARWINGMEAGCLSDCLEDGKTIVCGHWHASYGHVHIHKTSQYEFRKDSNFDPFYDNGIIAIDACTALTNRVNCIVIEDDPIEY